MKTVLMICLSLSAICGGLELNEYQPNAKTRVPAPLRTYWFKKTKKEALRYSECSTSLNKVIGNSLHFILCGLPSKTLPFINN